MKKVVAGMDLHSNNVVIGIMDLDGKRLIRALVSQLNDTDRALNVFWTRNSELGARGS
jgi:hypothetical protein